MSYQFQDCVMFFEPVLPRFYILLMLTAATVASTPWNLWCKNCWLIKFRGMMIYYVSCGWYSRAFSTSEMKVHLTLEQREDWGCWLLWGWKSRYNFWLHQNLPNNTLLLTGSPTDNINSWLTCFVCYMSYTYTYYFVCYIVFLQ